MRDIFLHSSNVGAGMLALEAGSARQTAFLARLGLLAPMRTEAGPVSAPLLPKRWGEIETVTIGYGHGLAVAPLQFAAAIARPRQRRHAGGADLPRQIRRRRRASERRRQLDDQRQACASSCASTSRRPHGTGRRAEAEGYRVGGKTGTAEMPGTRRLPGEGGDLLLRRRLPDGRAALRAFVAAVRAAGDRRDRRASITAGLNAAPVTARIVERIAPLLGVLPRAVEKLGSVDRHRARLTPPRDAT